MWCPSRIVGTYDITLYSAQQKIENQIMVFEDRKLKNGPYYNEALKVKFKEMLLELDRVSKSHFIDPNKFYGHLKQRMETHLVKTENICFLEYAKVLAR